MRQKGSELQERPFSFPSNLSISISCRCCCRKNGSTREGLFKKEISTHPLCGQNGKRMNVPQRQWGQQDDLGDAKGWTVVVVSTCTYTKQINACKFLTKPTERSVNWAQTFPVPCSLKEKGVRFGKKILRPCNTVYTKYNIILYIFLNKNKLALNRELIKTRVAKNLLKYSRSPPLYTQ